MSHSRYIVLYIVLIISPLGSFGRSGSKTNSMEWTTHLVNQLKNRVLPQVSPTSFISQIQNDDLYWIHWLKANSFELTKTSHHFLQNLKWRTEQKMDSIHLEDWSYFEAEYPAFIDSCDKVGRPIIEIWFSDWNIRRAVISGRSKKVIRWFFYNLEMGMRNIFQKRATGYTNVTGAIELMDYSNFNLLTHGCASCVPLYNAFQNVRHLHYPGVLEEIYMLNVPNGFKPIFSTWRNNLSPGTREVFKIYGSENEWLKEIQNKIDMDQLSTRFGGHKDRQT